MGVCSASVICTFEIFRPCHQVFIDASSEKNGIRLDIGWICCGIVIYWRMKKDGGLPVMAAAQLPFLKKRRKKDEDQS
jgi:hypothetical protein